MTWHVESVANLPSSFWGVDSGLGNVEEYGGVMDRASGSSDAVGHF